MAVVCREPLEVKTAFADLMNAVQIPYIRPYQGQPANNSAYAGAPLNWDDGPSNEFRVPRLYEANVLDYCNCPDNSTLCVGDYDLGVVTLASGRIADPWEADRTAKRMFVAAIFVLVSQMHLFLLTGTNVASVHLTVQGHFTRPEALKHSTHSTA